MFSRVHFIFTIVVCGSVICSASTITNNTSPKILLVSFDGFRADYLNRFPLHRLKELIGDGVLVEHVTNVFITKTFPNHYSIVTGLYAESHGIVANSMFDPDANKTFTLSNDSDPYWWNEATPIWVTNQIQGHKSAGAGWPGTDVLIQNTTPSYFLKYNPNETFEARIKNVTSWLTKSDDPINFVTLYWPEPDFSGHKYGPESPNMANVLNDVDERIGLLIDELKRAELWDKVNVIITSDHGMAQLSSNRTIYLDRCISRHHYTLVDESPVAAILPLQNKSYVYNLLRNCSKNMKVYLREDIPDRYHYSHNSRIQPIILVADEGWSITQNITPLINGTHGYDNALPSMHPLLVAHGPAFRKGYKQASINSVDIYPLMCHILGLKEEPNNGTFANTKCLLNDQWCVHLPEAIGIVVGVLMVLTTLTCLIVIMKNKMSSLRQFSRLQLHEDDDDPLIG
ncbi:bis(5'-adenosyl)-triphosphatase ENPP4 isoform X2 [Ambystoma mexicanum]